MTKKYRFALCSMFLRFTEAMLAQLNVALMGLGPIWIMSSRMVSGWRPRRLRALTRAAAWRSPDATPAATKRRHDIRARPG